MPPKVRYFLCRATNSYNLKLGISPSVFHLLYPIRLKNFQIWNSYTTINSKNNEIEIDFNVQGRFEYLKLREKMVHNKWIPLEIRTLP